MTRQVCGWLGAMALGAIGVELLLLACGGTGLPTAQDVADYEAAQLHCVDIADARPAADTCRTLAHAAYCARFPTVLGCPDAGE